MIDYTLTIRRGSAFHAHAWPLIDSAGNALRNPAGLSIATKIRPYPSSEAAIFLSSTLVMLTVPGSYEGIPVVAAQVNAMTPEQTAALGDLAGHVWELAVAADPIVGGLVETPWAVSR